MINVVQCCRCKAEFSIPGELYHAAKRSERISFWCPYGHEQHFLEGQSEEEKLRLERDRLKQQLAQKDDEAKAGWATANEQAARAARAEQATKRLKRRVAAGTCPCCQRTFSNMNTHMRKQHPDYVKDANVIPLQKAKASP